MATATMPTISRVTARGIETHVGEAATTLLSWADAISAAGQSDAGLAADYRSLIEQASDYPAALVCVRSRCDGSGPDEVRWYEVAVSGDVLPVATIAESRSVRRDEWAGVAAALRREALAAAAARGFAAYTMMGGRRGIDTVAAELARMTRR